MKKIGLFSAKTHLSELCRQVEETGVSFVIERRGKPVAELSRPRRTSRAKGPGIVADLARFETENPRDPGEPDFPDVWLERSKPNPDPLG